MRKTPLIQGEYYHIYNRGVDKREVFLNYKDYERFAFLLGACNDKSPLLNSAHYYRGFASIEDFFKGRKQEKLVNIVCFCLMPNHFHLLLRQREENGISKFIQKVSTGYTMYFNNKNIRSGALFQGVFKSVHVDKDKYLKHLATYIHSNPLELRGHLWKENISTKGLNDAMKFLKGYRWSSLSDYFFSKKFDAILDDSLLGKLETNFEGNFKDLFLAIKGKTSILKEEMSEQMIDL